MTSTLRLSPIDHAFTGAGSYPIELCFAYGGTLDEERLRASLRQVLAAFPAVSSRVVRLPAGALGLEPCLEGCPFETSVSDRSIVPGEPSAVFGTPVETLEGLPVARVRLTRTPDGSVLSLAISHAVVDGFAYFQFLSAWVLAFHGRAVPPACHDRSLLAPEPEAPELLDPASVRAGSGFFLGAQRSFPPREQLRFTRWLFTLGELRALVAEAQAGCSRRLSHNDVLAAWLWRRFVPGWTAGSEPTAWLSCPVDVRRVVPSLPPAYFGCAVALANASIEMEDLARAPLGPLARRVHEAVGAVDAQRVRIALATLDGLRRRGGLPVLERLHAVHPRAGLLVTNLSRLPVSQIAFDAGPPVAVDIPAPAERCAVVLPAEGGLDVRLCAPVAAPSA